MCPVNCNWNKEFATADLDVEALWNLLKDKIESGVKCCIPLTTRFQNTKWKRPLNDEIRDQIKSLKSLWRQYVRDKNPTSWLKYTKQRNKVKNLSEMILKTSRIQLPNSIIQIQKNFGNTSTLKLNTLKKQAI